MANGYTVEQILERVEARLSKLEEKIDKLALHGCAHRDDDLERIKKLEDWKTRGIIGFIGTTVIIIYEMIVKGGK
jgi:aryl-alcohol dehydrogenase-like predicted oxidoreductase